MKRKIPVFTITTLLFATLAVAQPAEAPSERELLCKDLVAFAFPESDTVPLLRSGLLVKQSGDSKSDILVRTFYPEEGLPFLRTRGRDRWGLSDHALPRPPIPGLDDQSRGVARLDRARRNQPVQEQIRILYNICNKPLNPSR